MRHRGDDLATMIWSFRVIPFLLASGLSALATAQQPPQLTLDDVLTRGPSLAMTLPKVLWFPAGHDGTAVLTADDGSQTMHRLEADQPAAEPWFGVAEVFAVLPTKGDKAPKRFPPMSWVDEDTLRLLHDDSIWHWDVGSKDAARILSWPDASGTMLELSPTRSHAAVRSEHQLFLHDRVGEKHQLTFDGSEDIVMADAAHRAEIGITKGTFFRADGRYLAFYREDQRPITKYPYQNVLKHPAELRHGRYPMAGRPHSVVRVLVCDTETYQVATLEADDDLDLYWTNVCFGPDDTVYVTLVNRGQDHLELTRFDAKTGKKLGVVLREHDREWIENEHPPTFLKDGTFLWWSSRSGYRHLYHYSADGKMLRQVTKGDFDVLSVQHLDADERNLWYQASGDDPRQLHLFCASLQEDKVEQITVERGSHQVFLSPDAERAHVFWSNLETKPRASILNTATKGSVVLPSPKNPLDGFTLPKQQFFEVAASDGTVLYGHVALPADLKPGERAPVIHYVYGGPHAQLIKDQWFGGAGTWLQSLTGSGFIVCRLDNRGTPNRGIEFEQAIHRHLGTIEVEDQLRAVDWLRQQAFVDPSRIGVHGWSFGGYMTLRLMLLHPEVFACGISGAPVTDWAMYETGYGERYMDSPQENPDGYEASSCLPIAGQLKNPLLVVHGTDDRTVMWSHTLRFVDACIAKGVQLDYFPYPQQLHGLRGPHRKHFLQKLEAFFERHLDPKDRGKTK